MKPQELIEQARESGYEEAIDKCLRVIDETIKNYKTMYGVKKETAIQSAFIFGLEEIKNKIKGED